MFGQFSATLLRLPNKWLCVPAITETVYKWGDQVKTPARTPQLGGSRADGGSLSGLEVPAPACSLTANTSHVSFPQPGLPVTSCLTHPYISFHSLLGCFPLTLSLEISQRAMNNAWSKLTFANTIYTCTLVLSWCLSNYRRLFHYSSTAYPNCLYQLS